jgi:cytochrome P450
MQAITLEVIMRAIFGITDSARLDRLRVLLRALLDWSAVPWRLLLSGLLADRMAANRWERQLEALLDPVDDALFEEIAHARADPRIDERDDILALLVQARHEDGTPMTRRELRDELMTLLLAGHETTATSLAWALERLLRHPPALARLREELEAGSEDYLEAVIKETLRLRPVLPLVGRRLTAPLELGGYVIPAGEVVAPCIYLVHRRADIYSEPDRFLPERFLDGAPGVGPYTWIPFGGGVRRCLGASFATFEMKVVLRTLAQRVTLRAVGSDSETVRRRAITFSPSRGAEVVLEGLRPVREHAALAA